MDAKLIYIGNGATLVHVPPRDLTEQDFTERRLLWLEEGIDEGSLIKSGLYKKPSEQPARKTKAGKDGEA